MAVAGLRVDASARTSLFRARAGQIGGARPTVRRAARIGAGFGAEEGDRKVRGLAAEQVFARGAFAACRRRQFVVAGCSARFAPKNRLAIGHGRLFQRNLYRLIERRTFGGKLVAFGAKREAR